MLYKALTVWQFHEWEVSVWTGPYESMDEAEVSANYSITKLEWNSERNALDLHLRENWMLGDHTINGEEVSGNEGKVIELVDENVSLRRVKSGPIRKSKVDEEDMEDVPSVMAEYPNLFNCSNPTFSSVSYGIFELSGESVVDRDDHYYSESEVDAEIEAELEWAAYEILSHYDHEEIEV